MHPDCRGWLHVGSLFKSAIRGAWSRPPGQFCGEGMNSRPRPSREPDSRILSMGGDDMLSWLLFGGAIRVSAPPALPKGSMPAAKLPGIHSPSDDEGAPVGYRRNGPSTVGNEPRGFGLCRSGTG